MYNSFISWMIDDLYQCFTYTPNDLYRVNRSVRFNWSKTCSCFWKIYNCITVLVHGMRYMHAAW